MNIEGRFCIMEFIIA